jgi:hypothetical protein
MSRGSRRATLLASVFTPALFGVSLATVSVALADPCQGPGAPSDTDTQCLTAVQIPGKPLRSFDISFVNPDRAEYYLADRSNSGIDIVDTATLKFKRRLVGGFAGVALVPGSLTAVPPFGTADNNHSGPDGVVSHGRWLYAGDSPSFLKVFDLNRATAQALMQTISTGGTTRVDEMALTTDGELLIAANNAEDPPFATLFEANGDNGSSAVTIITKITVDLAIVPKTFGLSIEQPAWDPTTKRFYVSIPVIANNPKDCNYGQLTGEITCSGGMLVIDPSNLTTPLATLGAFDKAANTGVVPLHECAPNGATVGPHDALLLGCTPQNRPADTTTLVINAATKNFANIGNITGSDEVWYNSGDNRYYTGSSRDCGLSAGCPNGGAVLGVIDGETSLLIEKIPQSSNSHSVAADSERNRIFVPQVAPASVVGSGGDTTTVATGICDSDNGCIAVYRFYPGEFWTERV